MRNYDDVKQEEDLKTQELEELRDALEALKSKKSEYETRINRLQRERNELANQKVTLEGEQQNRANIESKKADLEKEIANDDKEIKRIDHEIDPILHKIQLLEEAKRTLEKNRDHMINTLVPKINQSQEFQRDLNHKLKQIKEYENSGKAEKLQVVQKELTEATTAVENSEKKEKTVNEKLVDHDKKVHSKEMRKRILQDNKKLHELKKEIKDFKTKAESCKKKLFELNYDKVCEEKQRLEDEAEAKSLEKASYSGQVNELKKRIESLQEELNNDFYKLAKKNFREKLVEKCARDKVIDDLNKYYIALDWSITRFHQEKMREINRTMKRLWKQTYKGNDIDYIEIQSDDVNTTHGADKRKVNNYRVIMKKGDAELDMRGRCSAGQKVLGSLIIRLALAETFSAKCGIIALDEPTTNLDLDNIQSLAEALVDLVVNSHDNFQLIVITHDEDFLTQLTRADQVHHFFRVSRNDHGQSIIRKNLVSEVSR